MHTVAVASPPEVARRLGGRIRRLRKAHRLSWSDLSSRTGLASGDLARIEKGQLRLSLDTLSALLQALGEHEGPNGLFEGPTKPEAGA